MLTRVCWSHASRWCAIAVAGLCANTALASGEAWFTPIPGRPGDNPLGTIAHGISGNGTVVFGEVRTTGIWEAMRWTAAEGTTAHSPGAFLGASFDGSIMVGTRGRWTASGWTTLPAPPGGGTPVTPLGVSSDGNIAVGSARATSVTAPAKWNGTSPVWLPSLPGPLNSQYALRISDDGSRIVGGYSHGVTGAWASDGETSWMLDARASGASDMSPDGRWVVGPRGLVTSAGYRLDMTLGTFLEIPTLPDRQGGVATGVSADGSVVVGWSGTNRRAYIWDAVSGTRTVDAVLAGLGVDLGGFILTEARGVSDDGLTIVGAGITPQGIEQAWVARVPGPGTLIPLVSGAVVAGRRRRH